MVMCVVFRCTNRSDCDAKSKGITFKLIHFYSVQVGAASFSMGDKRDWTKEDTENFIEAVESFPEVWDVHSRDFKDRLKKTTAFNEIASIFDTSTKEVQRKWHNLKTQYSQELKKVQRVKSGSSGIVTVPRWPNFSALKFLESSVATTSERVSSLAAVEEEIQVHIEEIPPSPISEASKKKEES